VFIVRTIRNTQICVHSVGRMQSFGMLKQVETLGFELLKYMVILKSYSVNLNFSCKLYFKVKCPISVARTSRRLTY
jgi:hypothetical protein